MARGNVEARSGAPIASQLLAPWAHIPALAGPNGAFSKYSAARVR